jgi:hypothetical protein
MKPQKNSSSLIYFLFNCSRYVTEFSLPLIDKPIPNWTVKVHFTLKKNEEISLQNLRFRFENDSLIHTPDKTIRLT